LLAALAVTDEVKNAAATRQRRLKLQTSYGQALLWSKGFGAEETKVALTRAKELAAGIGDAAERFPTYYGLWLGSITRGEWGLARDTAEIFRHEAKTAGRPTEAAVASRNLGLTCLWQGHFVAARTHLEEALRIYDPERDREAKFRFGWDSGVGAMAFLAQANWLLGEVGRARELIEEAAARAVESAHVPTQANLHHFKALFEIVRGDAGAARREAEITIGLSQEHRIPLFLAIATLSFTCARARLGDETGTTDLRQTLQTYTDQGNKMYVPFFQGHLAELEAEQGAEGALSRIDAALALAGETGEHLSDAFLHRIRGEILLKRDPADTAPAEEAFLTAIAVAQEQKARSFGLRAALALARLYQSTNRAADAHAVLAPALEGFTPTPEFREIEEARTLLAALAESEEVKSAAAARQRRLKLQTSYGKAMMLSRGFASEESKVAFTRAHELGNQIGNAEERFDTYYGLFISKLVRGEIAAARETAEAFRREAEGDGRMTEVAAASRALGVACLYQGALDDAQTHLSEALRLSDQERDRDAKFRFGADTGVAASYLAQTEWYLGEIGRALELIEESVRRAAESGHVPTLALTYHLKGMLDMQRGDVTAALRDSEALVELTQEHPMALYHAHGSVHASWARARLGEGEAGIAEFERAIAVYADQGAKLYLPFYLGFLAELEGERRSADGALTRIDEALALSQQTGTYWIDSFLHRIRGEILLKRDPANTAPAEEAFRTAIAVAREQKAKSFELRAALSLAKLCRSTKRAADAHAVLAPALEGFSPTPEFPEIAEAQTLLATLAE
jgi:predicted ATPase